MFSQKEKKAGEVPAYFFDYRIKDKHLLTVFAVQGVSVTACVHVCLYTCDHLLRVCDVRICVCVRLCLCLCVRVYILITILIYVSGVYMYMCLCLCVHIYILTTILIFLFDITRVLGQEHGSLL
jgi:hypothetical protein